MRPCGAGKVKTRVYGPVRCEKVRHGFMGPCSAGKVKTRVYGPVWCEKVNTRVYGPVWCRESKDTGLWAHVVREK
ncbi:hypothetical protein CRG98_019881 [Punica granatum]|uniref:Uncharacterized protein n=1 Tax=Punica granatum TaxID=22663 RepID=A0A2I0JTS9_PUNGR|nr:hypothetical protein CRG98_019881 [Punica granatum]